MYLAAPTHYGRTPQTGCEEQQHKPVNMCVYVYVHVLRVRVRVRVRCAGFPTSAAAPPLGLVRSEQAWRSACQRRTALPSLRLAPLR